MRNRSFFKRSASCAVALLATAILGSGCGSSDNFVFTNTAPAPPAAPLAVDDAFPSLGNATLNQAAAGVLTNDTPNGAAISAFDAVGSNGGTVVLNNDGSFTYTPVFGFVGAETFTYTLDNGAGTSTATVTLTSTGQGFFVDNTAPAGGNGSQATPFNTLAAGIAAATNGDTVVVLRGDGTNNGLAGAINLPAGVDIIGEGAGLILPQTILAQGLFPVLTGPITVNNDSTISGLSFDTGESIIGTGVSNITITNNSFLGTGNDQVNLDEVDGNITVSQNTFEQDNDVDSIDIDTNLDPVIVVNGNTFNLANPTADGDDCIILIANMGSNATMTANDNTFNGSATGDMERGASCAAFGGGQATFTANNNTSSFMDRPSIILETQGASQLTATATGNIFDNNVDGSSPEIQVDSGGSSTLTATFTNNRVTNSQTDGFVINSSATSTLNIAIRDNTITGSVGDAVQAVSAQTSTLCLDITGNTVDDDMQFDDNDMSVMNVERGDAGTGGPLQSVNTFTSGAPDFTGGTGTLNFVNAGTCNIP